MKLVAIMPCRNEAWCLGLSLRVALRWCDEVVVLDHASTDATPDIIDAVQAEHPGRVHVIQERDLGWPEMEHRQRLLTAARRRHATHIAIVDADEVLTGNLLPTIRDQIMQLPPGGAMQVGMPCMWRSLDQYRVDRCIWANRIDLTLAFGDRPDLCWQARGGYDHHSREPHGSRCVYRGYEMSGGAMHLQWVSWRRLLAKHRAYRVLERIKYPQKPVAEIERLYSLALDERGLQTAQAPADWWAGYEDLMRYVDLDAKPWQEDYVRQMIDKHGAAYFEGLNIFEEALV